MNDQPNYGAPMQGQPGSVSNGNPYANSSHRSRTQHLQEQLYPAVYAVQEPQPAPIPERSPEEVYTRKPERHEKEKRPRKERGRRFSFWRFYFVICGIAINLYGLIWLVIQLLKRFSIFVK